MSNRFVILKHTEHGPEHWDFMLQAGDVLKTWQLEADPIPLLLGGAPIPPNHDLNAGGTGAPPAGISAVELPDHRLAYLDYEGPVSKGRGEVTRIAAGKYITLQQTPDFWKFTLTGQMGSATPLVDQFQLSRTENRWNLTRI